MTSKTEAARFHFVNPLIYLVSFLRRLRWKSSFYLALLPALILAFFFEPYGLAFLVLWPLTTCLFRSTAWLVHQSDLKQKTGVVCRICGYGDCVMLYPARRKNVTNKGSFACSSFDHGEYGDIFICPKCQNGFLKTIGTSEYDATRSEGLELYSNVVDYEYLKNLPARAHTYDKLLQKYGSYFKDKKVLEIGCYYGAFYSVVRHYTTSYTGIEPSRHAVEFLKQTHGEVDVLNTDADSALKILAERGDKFDTVVMYDVIEHLPDPIAVLKSCSSVLKLGGNVLFSTINIEASISLAMGPRWPWYMDMHYYYFSDRGYRELLSRSGYRLLRHRHFPYYVPFHYFVSKVVSLIKPGFRVSTGFEKKAAFTVPIKMGDTVFIIGQKVT